MDDWVVIDEELPNKTTQMDLSTTENIILDVQPTYYETEENLYNMMVTSPYMTALGWIANTKIFLENIGEIFDELTDINGCMTQILLFD